MTRWLVLLAVLLLPACRTYDYYGKVSNDGGLTPGDQYARYGREQAQEVAIARRFAQAHEGASLEDRARQVEAAAEFARTQPDVVEVTPDPQGLWLLLRFRSGWRTAVTPLDDGKDPADTPNLPQAAPRPAAQ